MDDISLRNHVDSLHFRGDIARTKLFIKMADFIRKTRHRQLYLKPDARGKALSDDLRATIIHVARHLMSTTSSNTQAVNDVRWNVLSQTIEDMEW
jgi:hypothetical protein